MKGLLVKQKNNLNISADFFENSRLQIDYKHWKLFRKKNTWIKLYKKVDDKNALVDNFCAAFQDVANELMDSHGNRTLYLKLMMESDTIAKSFSSSGIEFLDGWALHKNWFRCMFAQLILESSNPKMPDYLNSIFNDLNWDNLEQSINPVYDDITTLHYIEYRYIDKNRVESIKKYRILLTPIHPIPAGSKWQSKKGVIWQCQGVNDNGTFDFEPEDFDIYGNNVKYKLLKLTPQQVYGMKRV